VRMKWAHRDQRRDELTRTITTPMMIESVGRSPIKMGKELRMAQSSTPTQTQEQRVQEFV